MCKKGMGSAMIMTVAFLCLLGCTKSPARSEETEKCIVVKPEKPVACTMQYDPVCGCDGKTYGNACSARGAGVPRSTPGACEERPAINNK